MKAASLDTNPRRDVVGEDDMRILTVFLVAMFQFASTISLGMWMRAPPPGLTSDDPRFMIAMFGSAISLAIITVLAMDSHWARRGFTTSW